MSEGSESRERSLSEVIGFALFCHMHGLPGSEQDRKAYNEVLSSYQVPQVERA